MTEYNDLMEMLCRELGELTQELKGREMTATDLDIIRDITSSIKNICRIGMCDASETQQSSNSRAASSDFMQGVDGKDQQSAWAVMDELMDTLKVVNPQTYDSVMRKIGNI